MAILNANVGFTQLLFKIVPNPTIKPKHESGIILAPGIHKSQETGNFDTTDQVIGFGEVIAAGPECKYVEVGDCILFDRRSVRPVPLGHEVWNVSEQNTIAYIKADDPSLLEANADYLEAMKQYVEEGEAVMANNRASSILAGNGIIGLK